MAVTPRRRTGLARRPRKDAPVTSGTTFHILDQEGHDLRGPQALAGLALSRALNIIQRWGEDGDEATLYIERRTLFGDPVELYRVIRDEDGVVRVITTSQED
ncbi:MAG: hypothetical protein KGL39_29825 [Patescibacteria group bacterium]|nr:hypothetical protein [Patescibacteria group bacterium]